MTPKKTPIVLVADDEEEMRTMLEHFVASQGYAVHTAASGDEAWEKVQQHRPDLVLLDVRMPGLSGWEVSRNISHDPKLSHTRVIVITGIGERVNELTSPLFGAFAYLDKPFDISDLEAKINAALGTRKPSTPTNGISQAAVHASPEQGGFSPPRRKPAAKAPAEAPAKAPAAKTSTQPPAAKAPGKPDSKAPAKPAAKAPAKPAAKAPAKPTGKAPAKAPEKPSSQAPARPAKAPAKPPAKAPAKPAGKAPVRPAAKAPTKSAPKAPAKPAAKAPAKPAAKAPGKPIKKTPGKKPAKRA